MKKAKVNTHSDELSALVVQGMQEKKAEDIVIIDLTKIKNAIASYFVVCTGNSDTQINAIAESVQDEVKKKTHDTPWSSEGRTNREWILLDYSDVVVHVFSKEKRKFYALEDLWGDAKIIEIESNY